MISYAAYKLIPIHGISVLIILVAGFGLLARLGYLSVDPWPIWVWLKVTIWLILALIIILIKRMPELIPALWFLIPILGGPVGTWTLVNVTLECTCIGDDREDRERIINK